MAPFYRRWQAKTVKEAMKSRRVLLLSGARQCGKTTLAKSTAQSDTDYRTLDDLRMRQFAVNDPQAFVKHSGKMLIIDEVQRVPELFSEIKLLVDVNTEPGQFLLTGSTNIQSLPTVQESLAGRIRKIRLRGLTNGEVLGIEPSFLENAFKQKFITPKTTYDRKEIINIAFRGGFPEAIKHKNNERSQWHRDYLSTLIDRDLKDITKITRYQAMKELVRILAAWSGKFMDISGIGAGLGIRRSTIESYINALEALYVIERVQPWTKTDYERVGKQAKLFMTDSGLMSSILRWQSDQVYLDPDRSGKLIETLIFNELSTYIDLSNGKYDLFHYRDREKREIDFLIEREDHFLLGVEVKAGSSINQSDFKHLNWFKNNIAQKKSFVGIVLYTGDVVGSMGENLWAVPMSSLWV